jgi:RHS repeat-associated protein
LISVQEYSYDAWGRRRDPAFWDYNLSGQPALIADRGFTGARSVRPGIWELCEPNDVGRTNPDEPCEIGKHLTEFGLINMSFAIKREQNENLLSVMPSVSKTGKANGRLYDPLVGRFLSPDNYVQDASNSLNFNRYGYCLNNPLVYTDPDGELIIELLAAGWLLFTDSGYEFQKQVSPVAFHIDVHWGSEQKGIGADVSVGVPKALPVSYRAHGGATYYWGHYDGSYTGWETRYGGEWTLFSILSYSGTTFNSGGTSQTTGMFTIGGPYVNLKYENDMMFGFKLPGVPEADGGDRYRSAAARFKMGPFQVGLNLFTGDPGLDDRNITSTSKKGGKYGLYEKTINGDDPDRFRAGVVYFGFGPLRIGRNTEGIRDFIQNRLIHDQVSKSPYFRRLDGLPYDDPYYTPNKWYWYLGTGTGNTLW